MRALLAFTAATLAFGGPALAGSERAPTTATIAPHCMPIEKMKAGLKDTKFTVLNSGQFHFVAGLYVGSPITPSYGLPPGDGAILLENKTFSGIIWTIGSKEGCITPIVVDAEQHKVVYLPMPMTSEMIAILRQIKPGKDEATMGSGGSDPDELHL